jgi:hypothetical protein
MSYPESGTFESGGPCPSTHPVRTAQVMYEVVWDTKPFNDLDWPKDGSNPFVWSFGDATGYANHADYVFGWKDDALQKILDLPCHFATNCSEYGVKMQSIDKMNSCTQDPVVDEDIDSCKSLIFLFANFMIRIVVVVSFANVLISDCRAPGSPGRLAGAIRPYQCVLKKSRAL